MRLILRTVQPSRVRCPPPRRSTLPASFLSSSPPNNPSSFHQSRLHSLDGTRSTNQNTGRRTMTTEATSVAAPAADDDGAAVKTTTTTTTTTTTPTEPPTVTTRLARPEDAAAIAALGAAVFTATFEASGCTPAQLRAYLDESYTEAAIAATLASPAHTTLVAHATPPSSPPSSSSSSSSSSEPPPPLLGFALLNRASSAAEPCVAAGAYDRPVELQRLYVALGSHGRGVGRALVAAAEARARREGFATAWLGVWEDNARARRLYARLGYERVGEHMFDVGGDLQRDLIMVKAL